MMSAIDADDATTPAATGSTAGPARLDPAGIDWSRVTRAVYQVRQQYRYTYSQPVRDIKQRLIMVPPALHGDQRVVHYDVDVHGAAGATDLQWGSDAFGNRVCWVRVEHVRRQVDFRAHYAVERRGLGAGPPVAVHPAAQPQLWQPFLGFTPLTAPDARLRTAADGIRRAARRTAAPGDAGYQRVLAERAYQWTAGAMRFEAGVTGVHTPAATALQLGRGVCQDYAHIMLCVLRLLHIPARYVSGQLLGSGVPHAWVEALLEDPALPRGMEVVAYDPTHRRRPGLNYITVAVGRDFADITPTSGSFTGAAAGRLSYAKRAEALHVEPAVPPLPGGIGGLRGAAGGAPDEDTPPLPSRERG